MFRERLTQLANGASLKVAQVDEKHAKLLFNSDTGSQTVWILPYNEIWEFSCQSGYSVGDVAEMPQALLAALMQQNAQNKRASWCIEKIGQKFILSVMTNFPVDSLTAAEFGRICVALVNEVERFEKLLISLLKNLR